MMDNYFCLSVVLIAADNVLCIPNDFVTVFIRVTEDAKITVFFAIEDNDKRVLSKEGKSRGGKGTFGQPGRNGRWPGIVGGQETGGG